MQILHTKDMIMHSGSSFEKMSYLFKQLNATYSSNIINLFDKIVNLNRGRQLVKINWFSLKQKKIMSQTPTKHMPLIHLPSAVLASH
jgi:hypothetical protein